MKGTLFFPGGQCDIGAATSFTVDPMKTRWRSEGVTKLRWKAAPLSGVAVKVVSSAASPYESAIDMNGATLDGIEVVGGASPGARYAATGLQIGDGVNQTFSLALDNISVQGWTNLIEFKNNVWWISFNKPRLMWGAINTPATAGNWGENMTFHDPVFLDGVTFTMNYGDWKLFGGSLDNSRIVVKNFAHVAWFGAHIENPGSTTVSANFVDIQGSEATVHLVAPTIVINNNGTPIDASPFNVVSSNTVNGLILDSPQYTQGAHAGWFTMVSGGGRVRVRSPQILAFGNAHYQVIGENVKGQLRNPGFEAATDYAGWTTTTSPGSTSTASITGVRVRTGARSARLTANSAASGYAEVSLSQRDAIGSGQLLMLKFAFSRAFGSGAGTVTSEVRWLDAAGMVISTAPVMYVNAAAGTDDKAAWLVAAYNGFAPGGTVQAQIVITLQRPSGTGSASIFVDDVTVNVVD